MVVEQQICSLPDGYKPSEDEEFMNDFQREYFRRKLLQWRDELAIVNDEIMNGLREENSNSNDFIDKASLEADFAYELRSKERAKKLIAKIDDALVRIKHGTYGYCEETGEKISLKRLEARPVAVLSIEAQDRHEKMEAVCRDDE